jgi:hypothetical protein
MEIPGRAPFYRTRHNQSLLVLLELPGSAETELLGFSASGALSSMACLMREQLLLRLLAKLVCAIYRGAQRFNLGRVPGFEGRMVIAQYVNTVLH